MPRSDGERPVRSIFYPGERQAEAIRVAKRLAHEAHLAGVAARDALRDLEMRLHVVRSTDDSPELGALLERAEELQRKLNAMELGAFMIRVGNVLDEAWRRLP